VSNGIGTTGRAAELLAEYVAFCEATGTPLDWCLTHGTWTGGGVCKDCAGVCEDCGGSGGILDADGSLTGEVGRPAACVCTGFMPLTAEVALGFEAALDEAHRSRVVRQLGPVSGAGWAAQ
jgi:hypothetical protein